MSEEEPKRELRGRKPEEELPPELKATEAELSALRPRDDRLDRERLVFLAGQASVVGGQLGRAGRTAAWVWPVSFSAMTAVAATLLVMLLLRPEPQIVERIRLVEVPVEPTDREAGGAMRGAGRGIARSPSVPPSSAEPFPGTRASGSAPIGSPVPPDWKRFGSRAEYLNAFQGLLAQGVDPWRKPLTVSGDGDEQADASIPYRQRLKTLLDDQARAGRPSDQPSSPSHSGANS